MSSYRNYTPWSKGTSASTSTNYSGLTKKYGTQKSESSHYGTRPRIEISKADEPKAFNKLSSKLGTYSTSYQRDPAQYSPRSDVSRTGRPTDKKDSLHPPTSYRSLTRTGASSRESSPLEKSRSSAGNYNYNRLYTAPSYGRSVSRERTETDSSSMSSKYGLSKQEPRDELVAKYKATNKTTGKEELSSGPQKYITSRFLPKNTVEKSYTAYTRPSSLRTSETSRKNRELLNAIAVQQEQERQSRPVSRCSNTASEDISKSDNSYEESNSGEYIEEMETINVTTRATSPMGTNHPNIQRIRRTEIARTLEKVITRPIRKTAMVNKEVQSDRLDDTSRYSRYGPNSTRVTTPPWCSFLDMKYSSPEDVQKDDDNDKSFQSRDCNKAKTSKTTSDNQLVNKEGRDSPKSMSRSNSVKNLSKSLSKLSVNSDSTKSRTPSGINEKSSKTSSNCSNKKLPPQIPKNDKSNSPNTLNKDFRKSVLNMNHDGKINKHNKRSNSQSSVDSASEGQLSEATDVSENLTTCASYHKSSSASKLPQRITDSSSRRSCTPISDSSTVSSTTASGSDDDIRKGKLENKSNKKKQVNEADSPEKSPKPPLSPRTKTEGQRTETEAKSFLMKALAPVTNLFKVRHIDSSDKVNWMDSSAENSSDSQNKQDVENCTPSEQSNQRKVIRKVESGERAWWLDNTPDRSESPRQAPKLTPEEKIIERSIRHVTSGEKPWWIDDTSEVPEGVQQYPKETTPEYRVRRNDSDTTEWWLTSSDSAGNSNKNNTEKAFEPEHMQAYRLRHIDSGERAWWLNSSENIAEDRETKQNTETKIKPSTSHQESVRWWLSSQEKEPDQCMSDVEFDNDDVPLGDRASPEGLETPREDELQGRTTPYDNVPASHYRMRKPSNLFISKHTNIDDILGGSSQLLSPLMDTIFSYQAGYDNCEEIGPTQVKLHDSTPQRGVIEPSRIDNVDGYRNRKSPSAPHGMLDDAALQLYKDGDYGSYLDLEASISEQQEEFEGFQLNKKNSIVLRTQLSVRVHTIIEKLLTSEGRELRRALFSLKQIFQEDKDLVHEFVQNDGLACLIKVGSEADQNYQNYILRALGQVMLYVDGMNGVIEHNQTVQWLYTLISSKFRLVVKTALKLLLVFAEYTESNCMLLIKAIHTVDYTNGVPPWFNIMKLLKDFDSADTELLIYATTLVNKILNGIPDQDTYYDQTDALEEQGIEMIIQRYMSKPGTDLDLLQQFQIYEAVLKYEDGEEKCSMPIRHLDENTRKTLRNRRSLVGSTERRKSRRHSTGTTPVHTGLNNSQNTSYLQANEEDDESSSTHSSDLNNLNGGYKSSNKANEAGVTPALKRRRERAERQRSFMREQQESVALLRNHVQNGIENNETVNGNYTNALQQRIANGSVLIKNSSRKDLTPLMNAVNRMDTEENLSKQPWILSMMYGKTVDDENEENVNSENGNDSDRKMLLQLKRENTVKDLTQKLANQNILQSPSEEKVNRVGDMSGLILKAKEGLAKSKSKADIIKSPTTESMPKIEVKKSENELRWEELKANLDRSLNLCDMDFTDLVTDDETDILAPMTAVSGVPPPPPPLVKDSGCGPPPPPPAGRIAPPPAPNLPVFAATFPRNRATETKIPIKKNKKTVKLFWKEVRDDPICSIKLKSGLIWDELAPVTVDTQKLEHLFESRAKDLLTKKQQEINKNKEVIVLDPKRSNAINIGMTKLPPPRSIKTAILKMDATIMNREGIEKLLTMLPTEEERTKIQDAQAANPDVPLGSAEQFLLTLASISELPARLKLWAFKLDFENSEREIAEPLMDLKQGVEVLRVNKTFRGILSTLLSIGNFLNGNEVKGFQIEYLAKVPEVKDTVHKHSLLHHLCHIVLEKFPDATDLYSEIGAITRASKIDFDELSTNIQLLETDCKASWDYLKLIAKHDGSMMKVKMSDFLADCAERIILLEIIHRRVMNRYRRFLLWLGIPLHQVSETKPNEFCRIVSEFALEYRTTRERVLQQLEKKANHRERNKTRGKMITEIGKFKTKEDRADAELRQLLGSDISDVESMQGTLPWRRQRREGNRSILDQNNGNLTDGDDEILESLVKTATKAPSSRTAPRERKRTRHADRKSLKRSRTRENNPFGSRDSP